MPKPLRPGYDFVGWYDNKELAGEPYDISDQVFTADKTFYPKWEIPSIRVGGLRVTDENKDDIISVLNSEAGETVATGDASFSPSTNTLTLNDFVYTGTQPAFDFQQNMVIKLVGQNMITVNASPIAMLDSIADETESYDLTVFSDTDAELLMSSTDAISVNNLTVKDVGVTLSQPLNVKGSLRIENSEFTCGVLAVDEKIEIIGDSKIIVENTSDFALPKAPVFDQSNYKVCAGDDEASATEVVSPTEETYKSKYVKIVPKYTVTLDYGIESTTPQTTAVGYGDLLSLENPDYAGYFFMGWYADAQYTEEFDFTEPITEETTVYAKFFAPVEKVVEKIERPDPTTFEYVITYTDGTVQTIFWRMDFPEMMDVRLN